MHKNTADAEPSLPYSDLTVCLMKYMLIVLAHRRIVNLLACLESIASGLVRVEKLRRILLSVEFGGKTTNPPCVFSGRI